MPDLTKHDLYELCVQSPAHLLPFLRAVHGGDPRVLGEDFAGTAALSHLWADRSEEHRAVAIDLDADALRFRGEHERVAKRNADVRDAADPADTIFVGNFSIGYWHTRADLVAYLRHARSRLNEKGVFVCDTYGGETAHTLGEVHRDHWIADGARHPGHAGKRIRYTWEQRHADPITGRVTDVIHFRVEKAGIIEQELFDAFTYEWRLWSITELRDAMADAGFSATEVYAKTADAIDDEGNAYVLPIEDGSEELDDTYIVLIAARV
jgi:hypothetical protein